MQYLLMTTRGPPMSESPAVGHLRTQTLNLSPGKAAVSPCLNINITSNALGDQIMFLYSL